jgi:hypothetical protein
MEQTELHLLALQQLLNEQHAFYISIICMMLKANPDMKKEVLEMIRLRLLHREGIPELTPVVKRNLLQLREMLLAPPEQAFVDVLAQPPIRPV